ncbi:uncharacterized protein EV420DRAFT_1651193 [Desarmillaria tabescens]|uniref:Nephrocystin 3-like N-terminal domain-containing protein n=1 Tax=Armillaria tabescens TaxID=1929756 RepID=A0AA39JBP8_ARMTA|nr:uncharacterized protein EV420DRAFT_1651587 [Desarmillaria tabescens]XP_060323120.1 uncharacterized protein EV420DRAFT_1651193 [Desarmillaria tabescens]KAK0438142.1 hypothetical protein EV420DRAFT_1651587 [Desarmillaria tabescens]KAK0439050.1 hypothetical protein EV420DRAFT_1651193 [Desarmillaria tabescens]
MSEVIGAASSVTAVINNIITLISYVKDVSNAPEEMIQISKELEYLRIYLTAIKELMSLSPENDPWLETLKRLFPPPDDARDDVPGGLFKELTELFKELDKKLVIDPPQWKKVKKRLLWTLTKTSVEEDLQKIERFKTLVMSAVQLDDVKLSHAIKDMVADLKGTFDGFIRKTEQLQMRTEDAEMEKWLTAGYVDYKSIQEQTLKKCTEGTGQRFLTSPVFLNWKDGPSATCLWCPGQPGAGKSVLASIIVEDLETLVSPRKALVLCIFCDYEEPATTQTIVCSLLKQTIQSQGLSSHSKSVYIEECVNNGRRQPSDLTLSDTLSKQLRSYKGHVYIVLDALDEFNDDDGGQGQLIDTLRSLGDNVRVSDRFHKQDQTTQRDSHFGQALYVVRRFALRRLSLS